jgi:DNA-binding MarR family transcriptional regulator
MNLLSRVYRYAFSIQSIIYDIEWMNMLSGIRLPKSALVVLDCLNRRGPMPPRVISKESKVPLRTVTFALDRLVDSDICQKVPNLGDMRRTLYVIDQEKARTIFLRYGMMFS